MTPRKVALLSFLASLALLALKSFAYSQTGSTAVLSDAMESIVNVVAAGLALMVMRAVAAPADAEHPYGHGKLEYFSAAFEGGLVAFAGLMIAREAIISLLHHHQPQNLDLGLWLSALAAAANCALGFYLLRFGKKENSEALKASGQHLMTDVWSTLGVLVGLGLVRLTGLYWFDPLAALLTAGNILYSGYFILRRSIGALIDEAQPQVLSDLANAFRKNRRPGVIDIHLVKLIRSGKFHHIDGHLVVPEFWQVSRVHDVMTDFEKNVVSSYPFDGEINFHLDPCEKAYCSHCDLPDCPIRQRPFENLNPMTGLTLVGLAQRDQL